MHLQRTTLAIAASLLMTGAFASSHREAPSIAQNPSVDGTDFYVFRSYEPGREAFVTLLANYNPLQDSYGGPNYFALNPNALYEIHVDNNADAVEDITFQFRFTNTFAGLAVPTGDGKMLPIPLINLPPSNATTPTLNRTETYTVNVVRGNRRTGTSQALTNVSGGGTTFTKPVDNIGTKSIPDYAGYASRFINSVNIPGCATPGRVFVGQRREGFAVNLGEVFDLVNLNPLDTNRNSKGSATAIKNITTLAMEVPIACLTRDANSPVIGAWTTASLRQSRVLNAQPSGTTGTPRARNRGTAVEGGAWTQVSRLGSPLVNEVVIGVTDKDRFNASEPKDDPQFIDYVTNPTLPVLLNVLFGNAARVPPTPRNDLVAAFLTGVNGVNGGTNGMTSTLVAPGEMLRLNTAIPATAAASQQNVGAALCFTNDGALNTSNPGCDPAGFPNGRRPGDDVVDIELSVVTGFLLGANNPNRNAQGQYQVYHDQTLVSAADFDNAFPYLRAPRPGSPNGTGPNQNGIPNPVSN
jgi:hypothetical protein